MRRIAAVGMMLILAGMQAGCFESVTEAPLEIPGSEITRPRKGSSPRSGTAPVTIGWRAVEGAQRYRVYRSVDAADRFERSRKRRILRMSTPTFRTAASISMPFPR